MHLYEDQFCQSHDFPRVERPSKTLIIASTARCGSHMLGHALHKTESFGFPLEYTNPKNLAEWKKRLGKESLQDVLSELQQRRTSPNGVFSAKIHYSHIAQFGGFDKLKDYFSNAYYVLLSRKDVLRQAVSLSMASQTGVWISGQKPVNENPEYNFDHIKKRLRSTVLDNSSWRYSLAASGSRYIEVDFDYARDNLAQSIQEIADFLDVKVDSEKIPERQVTKKQGGDINKEWITRFIADFDSSEELISKTNHERVSTFRRIFRL